MSTSIPIGIQKKINDLQLSLQKEPDHQDTLYQLAFTLFQTGQNQQVQFYLQRLININPEHTQALHLSALSYLSQQQVEKALPPLLKASNLAPNSPEILINLGNVYGTLQQLDHSITCYEKALNTAPHLSEAWFNMGNSWSAKDEPVKAKDCFEKAIELNAQDYRYYVNLGTLLIEMGQLEKGFQIIDQSISLAPPQQRLNLQCGQLFLHLYNHHISAQELWQKTRVWGEQVELAIQPLYQQYLLSCEPERKLNIGYLSSGFCNHAASFYADAYFKDWDSNLFVSHAYADVRQVDQRTREIQQSADHFSLTAHLSDYELAKKIYDDQIDILVDPGMGHTKQNRMYVFALQPAPIQMTIYPTTIGLSRIQYKITDPLLDPPTEKHDFSEKLLYLPDNIFYYNPPVNIPTPAHHVPEKKAGYLMFGSFNHLPKINAQVIAVWAQILKALPESKLLLKTRALKESLLKEDILKQFNHRGIESERIVLKKQSPDFMEHLRQYNTVDIALDPFPYNGHTTTLEALLMGVPVIALRGENHFGKIAANLLHTLGLEECIALNIDDYIHKSLALAQNQAYRHELKQILREQLLQSPLCQRKKFVHHLGTLYRQAWKNWCQENKNKFEPLDKSNGSN